MVSPDRSGGLGIEGRCAIHDKQVVMVAVRQRHLDKPSTIHPPLHRKRIWIPIIEIPHQINGSSVRFCVVKIDRLRHILCRIGRGRRTLKNCIHTSSCLSLSLQPLSVELIPITYRVKRANACLIRIYSCKHLAANGISKSCSGPPFTIFNV